ncbi:acyltransferase [Erythrobacter sp. CCH5-A1]|uniref:acyltransferase family protein n=1 Tax=Erythrobacter sp. CCH5-A1 TaxID=1768792 RepID=UPI0009E6DBF8|nr:acyltransferase [Erythrobacter sp. CCH5-A1]
MGTTFHGLHSLRGLAAVAVLLFHAKAVFGTQLAPSGYLAVDLFFILSGFVIAHSYDPRFEAGLSPRTFILARAARFWPLFALGTAFGAAWLALENIVAPPAALSIAEVIGFSVLALAYVPAPAAGDLFPLNVPAWSLFFELIVNAGFALFFSLSKTRWLLGVVAMSAVALAIILAFDLFDVQTWGGVRAIYGFSLGVLLYRSRWSPAQMPEWFVIAVVCATFALPEGKLVEAACVFLVYPLAIATLAFAGGGASSRLPKILGDLSFPLYALHYPILQAALGVSGQLALPAWLIGLAAVAGCFVTAWLGEVLIDRPIRRALKPGTPQ